MGGYRTVVAGMGGMLSAAGILLPGVVGAQGTADGQVQVEVTVVGGHSDRLHPLHQLV